MRRQAPRDLANHLDALSGVLEVHRCLSRPTMTVGECIRGKLCACSCELLIVPDGFAAMVNPDTGIVTHGEPRP